MYRGNYRKMQEIIALEILLHYTQIVSKFDRQAGLKAAENRFQQRGLY